MPRVEISEYENYDAHTRVAREDVILREGIVSVLLEAKNGCPDSATFWFSEHQDTLIEIFDLCFFLSVVLLFHWNISVWMSHHEGSNSL